MLFIHAGMYKYLQITFSIVTDNTFIFIKEKLCTHFEHLLIIRSQWYDNQRTKLAK